MAFWGGTASTYTSTALAPGTETIVVSVGAFSVPRESEFVLITVSCNVTHLGTTNTATNLRLRRGLTLSDPIVGITLVDTNLTIAGTSVIYGFAWTDTLLSFATVAYSLTVLLTGTGANGSCLSASIAAITFL